MQAEGLVSWEKALEGDRRMGRRERPGYFSSPSPPYEVSGTRSFSGAPTLAGQVTMLLGFTTWPRYLSSGNRSPCLHSPVGFLQTSGLLHCSLVGFSALLLSCSVVSDSATPWTVTHQPLLSMGFSRHEYWSGLPCPPPGDLPTQIEPVSLTSPALAGGFVTNRAWSPFWGTVYPEVIGTKALSSSSSLLNSMLLQIWMPQSLPSNTSSAGEIAVVVV